MKMWTPDGIGDCTKSVTERGRKLFLVEGSTFSGWYPEEEVESHGTTAAEESDSDFDDDITYGEDPELDQVPAPQEDEPTDAPEQPEDVATASLRTSAWVDVRDKAKRLRDNGALEVHSSTETSISGIVRGDNGDYSVSVHQFGNNGDPNYNISGFQCSCPWGNWAYNRETYYARMCAHSLAMYWEMQSLGYAKKREERELNSKFAAEEDEFPTDPEADEWAVEEEPQEAEEAPEEYETELPDSDFEELEYEDEEEEPSERDLSDDGIARAATAYLQKVAGKQYTMAEQQALIDEEGLSEASIASLNLQGTHYIDPTEDDSVSLFM